MKAFYALVALPFLVLANPIAEPEVGVKSEDRPHLERRAVTCALTGSDVKYRQRPTTASDADGQFGARGTRVSFSCWTTGSTVNGNNLWNKIASGTGAGRYVSDYFITRACSDQITTRC